MYDDPDDPTEGVGRTLLKTVGDDGKALVDAIGGTYNTAKEAATADETAGMISGLTGEDGAVRHEHGGHTRENSDNITASRRTRGCERGRHLGWDG